MERAASAAMAVAAVFLTGLAGPAAGTAHSWLASPTSWSSLSRPTAPGQRASWTASSTPVPAGARSAALVSVACPAATSCAAAGDFWDSSGTGHGLLVTGHAAAWTATRAPLPAGAAAGLPLGLGGVACPSVTSCVAAGGYQDPAGDWQGVLVTGHGTTWTATRAPVPAGADPRPGLAYSGLGSVACASAAACVATGGYTDAAGDQQGLLLTGHGTTWTATRAPVPAGAGPDPGPTLGQVACPSASSCVVIGSYTDAAGDQHALLLTGHGSTWTASKVPLPAGAGPDPGPTLGSVACPSASSCVVIGSYTDARGHQQGLLLTGHGSTWTASQAPVPAGGRRAALGGVACPSAASCAATGEYWDATNHGHGLLVTGHGSTWTATRAPLPAGAGANLPLGLGGVACPSAATCAAVGDYEDSAGKTQGLLLTRLGSTWTASKAPVPAGTGTNPGPALVDVACASAVSCAAVGDYTDSAGRRQGLLLTRLG